MPPSTAHKVIAKTRDQISGLLDHAAHLAEVAQETIVEEASTAMTELVQAEIDRLRSLAKVNPNVREEEIVHFETSMQNLERYVRAAQLKLDAIRVVIAT